VGSLSLWGRWFEHRPEEDCHSGNVLARLSKEWWTLTTVVIADVAIDVASSALGCTAIVVTFEPLLERRVQLH
jgi:hypothetical protein